MINFKINEFEGPLDYLLTLMKEKKLDVSELSLYLVVDSYLEMVEREKVRIEEMYEYVKMAAKLLRFKTDFYLTDKEKTDSAKKNTRNLIKSLLEYQRYRDLSKILNSKYLKGFSKYRSGDSMDYMVEVAQNEAGLVAQDSSKFMEAFQRIAKINAEKQKEISTINVKKLQPSEIWEIIKEKMPIGKKISMFSLVGGKTADYIAMAILTILDMSNKGMIKFVQDNDFEDVILERIKENED